MRAIIFAAVVAVLGCAAGCAKSVPPPKFVVQYVDGPTSIQGVIQDSRTNERLPGATVIITRSPALEREQARITDNNGAFTFGDLAPGSYKLQVYADKQTATFRVSVNANTVTQILLELDPGSVGEVLEASGA